MVRPSRIGIHGVNLFGNRIAFTSRKDLPSAFLSSAYDSRRVGTSSLDVNFPVAREEDRVLSREDTAIPGPSDDLRSRPVAEICWREREVAVDDSTPG